MKLSNKILLGFFGFIFLYLTAVFAEVRLTGNPHFIRDRNSITETAGFSGFAFLTIRDINRHIDVIGSDRSSLEVRSISGGLLKKLTYKVSGDTLILSGFDSEENNNDVMISVFVPRTMLKGITVTSSVVTVRDLQQELLHILQNAARVFLTDSKISKIQMDATEESSLNINKTYLDTLSATIERSQVNINSPIGLLQGSLKNKASLNVRSKIREFQFKTDESSKLSISQ